MHGNTLNPDSTPAIVHAIGVAVISIGVLGSTVMALAQLFG